jgi:hypothetical protein
LVSAGSEETHLAKMRGEFDMGMAWLSQRSTGYLRTLTGQIDRKGEAITPASNTSMDAIRTPRLRSIRSAITLSTRVYVKKPINL